MFGTSLKLDYVRPLGTLTSITAYDRFNELLTGDQFNFLPIPESVLFKFLRRRSGAASFLDVNAVSEALHFASPATKRVRWIVGAYLISTDRFISTGNVFDLGTGECPRVAGSCRSSIRSSPTLPTRRTISPGRCSATSTSISRTNWSCRRRCVTTVTIARTPPRHLRNSYLRRSWCCIPGAGSRAHLGRLAAKSHVAPQADTRFHAISVTAAASAAAASIKRVSVQRALPV